MTMEMVFIEEEIKIKFRDDLDISDNRYQLKL